MSNSAIFPSPERIAYQLVISRLDGNRILENAYRDSIIDLTIKGIGGFIVFGGQKNEVRSFIHQLQSFADTPLFIASDIERGVGQQVKNATIFPTQMAVAAAINKYRPQDVALLEQMLKALSNEAKDVGINMPLTPVLDVNQNPDNPIICTRAFSDDPEVVKWFGTQYIRVLEAEGLVSCAKHFPGHGDTSVDSHISLPVLTKSLKSLMAVDIMPFEHAIRTGVSSIMIGHLSIPSIDARPASVSKEIITALLRIRLGFHGLVITDALNMSALRELKDLSSECINAGADILLHPVDVEITVKELSSALRAGKIDRHALDVSLNRILKIKKRLIRNTITEVDHVEHQRLSARIFEKSITMVKNTEGILPISASNQPQLIFAGDDKYFEASPLKKYFKNASPISKEISVQNKLAVFSVFTSISAWRGSSGIEDTEKRRIHSLIRQAKHSVVLSFGSPYLLNDFQHADVLIAAYDVAEEAQNAAIRCLRGEVDFNGHVPVTLLIES
ncbi:MAG: glycoside hydrolase family 3 protein [Dissulfurispiraceae bacterium]